MLIMFSLFYHNAGSNQSSSSCGVILAVKVTLVVVIRYLY